ncbi:hypothetical protein GCM10011579_031650 [Streptomyces albiflavescens]|uniref:Transposase IS701-like DDE domain-containing protein n=1 Tax=Streptomyces albiflavescens TaxID=1623582 RepID=A0A918D3X8_9ACTN|nr:hypothetical protein GCM10011579_031650 [Streptomyces albiflavescens]
MPVRRRPRADDGRGDEPADLVLAELPRKNCWSIAEWAGESSLDGMQHLHGRARWDADTVRDDVRGYVVEHLHDEDAVLVVDETGDVKKGTHSVRAQRQYTGTADRIENAQVAVYLVYADRRGHAAVDREPYIPRSWTSKPDRCRAAGLDEDTVFATDGVISLCTSREARWISSTRQDACHNRRVRGLVAIMGSTRRGSPLVLGDSQCPHPPPCPPTWYRATELSRTCSHVTQNSWTTAISQGSVSCSRTPLSSAAARR